MSTVAHLRKSKLLAVAPETVEPKKPKILVYGPPGVGKSWAAMSFPDAYYIDSENGADLGPYRERLKQSGGAYYGVDQGALSFENIIEQVEALATEKHRFKTLVIDSITKVFNNAIIEEQIRLGDKDAFGQSKKNPIRQMQRLLRWINRADLNVILIAHQKDSWGLDAKGNREVVGQTFDCHEKLEFELHLCLRILKLGAGSNAKRFAIIGKSRLQSFPEGDRFDWDYASFAERYGRDVIEKTVVPLTMATPGQIAELNRLLELVKLPEDTVGKWLAKSGVDSFEEMDTNQMAACIKFLLAKLNPDAK